MTGFGITIAIKRRHNLFFQFILICRVDNAVGIAAFEVDPDIVGTVGDRFGFAPIHLAQAITVFVTLHGGVAPFFKELDGVANDLA